MLMQPGLVIIYAALIHPLLYLIIDILNFTTGLETEVVHVISLYKVSQCDAISLKNNRVLLCE